MAQLKIPALVESKWRVTGSVLGREGGGLGGEKAEISDLVPKIKNRDQYIIKYNTVVTRSL